MLERLGLGKGVGGEGRGQYINYFETISNFDNSKTLIPNLFISKTGVWKKGKGGDAARRPPFRLTC